MQLEHGSCNCQIGTGGPATSNVSIHVCPLDSPWAHWAGMGKKRTLWNPLPSYGSAVTATPPPETGGASSITGPGPCQGLWLETWSVLQLG